MNYSDKQNTLQSISPYTLQNTPPNTNTYVLCDISDIRVDKTLPPKQRVQKYLSDGYNPYRFIVDGTVINIGFTEERSLTSCLVRAFDAVM